jgi:hypothetical protein
MKTSHKPFPLPALLATLLAITPALGAPAAHDPAALNVLRGVQGKLATSSSFAVTAKRSYSLREGTTAEPISLTVERPNRFLAHQGKGGSEKILAYDGNQLRLIFPTVLLHAEGKFATPDAAAFADAAEKRFGFRPPLAELLAPDLVKEMAREGAVITLGKPERVGWTSCQRVVVSQAGQTTEIWVGAKDSLPRRYRITFTDAPGQQVWQETRFKSWKFGVPVSPDAFRPAPPAGSQSVPLLKGN